MLRRDVQERLEQAFRECCRMAADLRAVDRLEERVSGFTPLGVVASRCAERIESAAYEMLQNVKQLM